MTINKVGRFMNALRDAKRMRLANAVEMITSGQIDRLIKNGEVVKTWEEDPDYLLGIAGKKPFCAWVSPGPVVVDRSNGRAPRSPNKNTDRCRCARSIEKAAELLRLYGYTVTEPKQ